MISLKAKKKEKKQKREKRVFTVAINREEAHTQEKHGRVSKVLEVWLYLTFRAIPLRFSEGLIINASTSAEPINTQLEILNDRVNGARESERGREIDFIYTQLQHYVTEEVNAYFELLMFFLNRLH